MIRDTCKKINFLGFGLDRDICAGSVLEGKKKGGAQCFKIGF